MGATIGIDASGPLMRWVFIFRDEMIQNQKASIRTHGCVKFDPAEIEPIYAGEVILHEWFKTAESWKRPIYDTRTLNGKYIRMYYTITTWNNAFYLLASGIDQLIELKKEHNRSGLNVCCTGSRKKELFKTIEQVIAMKHLMNPCEGFNDLTSFIRLKGLKEINCTTRGFDYFLTADPSGCFRFRETAAKLTLAGEKWVKDEEACDEGTFDQLGDNVLFRQSSIRTKENEKVITDKQYPFLLVHIKNGCSFHLVTADGKTRRVGGSVIGPGTFLGLSSILCPSVKSPFDAFLLACTGDNSKVDIQVSDIYGGDYGSVGLEGQLIASSFGKMQPTKLSPELRKKIKNRMANPSSALTRTDSAGDLALDLEKEEARLETQIKTLGDITKKNTMKINSEDEDEDDDIKEADIARSLLTLMTYNITQQAYLNAILLKVPRIVFSGFYLEMPGYLSALQACVHFWDSTGGIGGQSLDEPIDTVFIRMAPFLAAAGAALSEY